MEEGCETIYFNLRMSNHENLLADFSLDDFVKVPSFPHGTQKSIMPVVAIRGNEVKPLGTCFAVSNHGLVLTAKHVIDAVINWGADTQEWQIGVLYISEATLEDNVSDLMGGFIYVNRVYSSKEFDIGIMHLNMLKHVDTGDFIPMPLLKLSPAIPAVSETCITLGYHSSTIESDIYNPRIKTIAQTYSASRGVIEEIHFPKRDNSFLNFPCFRTSMRNEHGMSGAPVLSNNGNVIGVICSGFKGENIYYVSLIGPALFLQLDGINAKGAPDKMFLYDFISGGAVVADDTINRLTISRKESTLEINFGKSPIFWGGIITEQPNAQT